MLKSRGHKYFIFNRKTQVATSIRAWSEKEALIKVHWSKDDCTIEITSKSSRPKPIE